MLAKLPSALLIDEFWLPNSESLFGFFTFRFIMFFFLDLQHLVDFEGLGKGFESIMTPSVWLSKMF